MKKLITILLILFAVQGMAQNQYRQDIIWTEPDSIIKDLYKSTYCIEKEDIKNYFEYHNQKEAVGVEICDFKKNILDTIYFGSFFNGEKMKEVRLIYEDREIPTFEGFYRWLKNKDY
jgi:hypothetical protein